MGKKVSLHIGMNRLSSHYIDFSSSWRVGESTALFMENWASESGFECKVLLTEQATKERVIDHISHSARELKSGDTFVLSFCGHGMKVPYGVPDSYDAIGKKYDEAWCLFDKGILDFELFELCNRFNSGVRVYVFSDCCFAGSSIDGIPHGALPGEFGKICQEKMSEEVINFAKLPYNEVPATIGLASSVKTYCKHKDCYQSIWRSRRSQRLKERDIRSKVLVFAACEEAEYCYQGKYHSIFAQSIRLALQNWRFDGTNQEFLAELKKWCGTKQTPRIFTVGNYGDDLRLQKVIS